ncbi:uncharacterized protein BX664DRAFT_261021 [Halteromyces radiatus]|uniref:uncharacterized protein n=1 Tax=Halteromyces radiatus TaxID=101107 RepID=UPI00221EC2DD|nr:uncharacterized protein BX664DRAFT_261021 [Halteromyces radiatus]KAI8093003.1 hypothetical protein BX664DRAFT_261021 [Halteromyces radiatus]
MIKPTLPYRLQLCLRFMTLLSKLTTTEKTLSFLDSSQLGSVTKAIEQTVHAIIELDPIAVYVTTVRSLEVSSTTTSSPSSTSNEAQRQFLEILTCICDGLDIVSKLFGLISTGVLETKMIYEDLILTCLQMIKNQLDNTIYPLIEVNDCTDEITGAIGDAQLLLSFANSNSKAKHIMSRFLPLISRIIRRTHCLVQKDDTDEHAVIVLAYISMGSFFHDYNNKVTTITTTSEPIYTNITYYMSALNTYEHLKLVSLDMLRNVFGHFPRHRRWILEEILTSIGSLTTVDYRDNKRYSGNDKIHILSALFMQLIQCCDYSLDGSIQVQRTWLKKWELKVQKVEKDIVKRKELDQALTNRAAGVWKKGIESAVQNTTYFLEFLMSK